MELRVSALLATNRSHLRGRAVEQICRQEFNGRIGLCIEDGNRSHGAKMDFLFKTYQGDFAVVFDDDDDYAESRVARLIAPMLTNPSLLCVGTSLVYYVDERIGKAWLYDNAVLPKSFFWMAAPFYRRAAYEQYGPWEDLKAGADLHFLRKIPRELVLDLRDPGLMVCRIHGENAASKNPVGPAWTEVSVSSLPKFYAPLESAAQ